MENFEVKETIPLTPEEESAWLKEMENYDWEEDRDIINTNLFVTGVKMNIYKDTDGYGEYLDGFQKSVGVYVNIQNILNNQIENYPFVEWYNK